MLYKRIAFYGKGGIGKSTIAANLSANLSKKGKKILHIGCDPKADSTRLLMKRRIPTVLNLLREKGDDLKKEDILFGGVYGVSCLEAGGPEPGLGCAGMGISSVIELLTRLGVFEMDWDLIVYDVLGDVVCGGFSIPMRKNYVDQVYIVTSSEFMSLYAANNILKGIKNFATRENKIFAGIIHNKWTLDRDKKIIDHYIKESQGHLVTSIQEDDLVKRADYQKSSVFELDEDSPMARNIDKLGKYVLDHHRTFDAQPLDEEELEKIFEFIFSQEQI